MPGPLPNAQSRRRNAPTISTTQLPAEGRKGRIPACPYKLGKAGTAWWKWAWRLPHSTQWDAGALYVVARRAQLEDELAALGTADTIDLADIIGEGFDDQERARELEWLIRKLKSHAGGSTPIMREMRELDNRLGLNPKAMSELRWSIAESAESSATAADQPAVSGRKASQGATVRRLRAVDPSAVAS